MSATKNNVAVVRVIPGEPLRFQVGSKSHPGEYHLVDLEANGGAAECDCIRFQTVCWPIIRDTGHLPPGQRCRHIRAARELALNLTIEHHLAEQLRK